MKFEKKVEPYLNGTSFSKGLKVQIAQGMESANDRLQIIENLVAGRSVIHVGCVDHIPLLDEKIKKNRWLHARMCKTAKRCLGIDINEEGIRYLIDTLGYSDVICADLTIYPLEEILENQWDFLILGEVLEHIQNPVMFLKKISEYYRNNVNCLIISVPHAFSYLNITYALIHKEIINSDHYYWFTPYTLAKIVTAAGMHVEYFQFCEPFSPLKDNQEIISYPLNIIRHCLTTLFPATHQTLVMVIKL
jgi:2-polyprenyl-3-methyl-5-hydroxy-6-metoxy-1,4-benzoquinol methylase